MILSPIEYLFTIIHKNQWDKLSVDHPYSEYNKNTIKEITKNMNIPTEQQQQINYKDLEILLHFKHNSYLYEFQFQLIEIKFGLLNIINLLPFIGPFISLIISFKLLLTIRNLNNKIPLDLQLLLLINIFIEFGIGLIPLFGIVGGILYKANSRNYKLLQDYLVNIEDYTIELSTLEIPVDEQNEKKEPILQEELEVIPPSPVKVLDLLNKKSKNNTTESGSISSSSSSSIINTGKSTSIATITTSNTNVMASPFQNNSTNDDSKIDEDSKSIKSIKTLSKLNHVDVPKKNKKKKKKKKKTTE